MRHGMWARGGRIAVGCAMVATLAVAATACSSGGSGKASAAEASTASDTSSSASTTPPAPTTTESVASSASSASSVPPAPTTSVPSTSASLSQTSGAYLQTLLPVAGTEALLSLGPVLPAGWTANPVHELDSGAAATAAAPSLVGGGDCGYLIKTSPDLDVASGLSVASATEPLTSSTSSASLALYAYGPGDAAKSFAQVRQDLASACDGFTAMMMAGAVHVDVSATPVSGLGDEALLVKVTPDGPYVDTENLVVRHGNLMLSLSSNNALAPLPDLSPVAASLVAGMG